MVSMATELSTRPKRLFQKGAQISTFAQLDDWLKSGGGAWVYLRDKPLHPGMLFCMQYGTIKRFLALKLLWEAKKVNNGK